MIVTVTANPSLDRTVSLRGPLEVGEVQSAIDTREDAGGKGVNVARAIVAGGGPALAVVPVSAADPYAAALRDSGIPVRLVTAPGTVRANITLTDVAGVTTKINLPGARMGESEVDALIATVVDASAGADWLVLAGSLPPGAPDDLYVTMSAAVRTAHGADAPRIAVDTSGAALRAVVDRGAPDLIKPNDEELTELAGAGAGGDLDAAGGLDPLDRLARSLVPQKVAAALVTLGGDGALLVTSQGTWHASPPPTVVRSTVGAGDSSLAGYLLADAAALTPEDCLRNAVRYGSAAASLPGTAAPTPDDLSTDEIAVRPLHR